MFEKGIVVKFKNNDGTLNGGTIIDLQKQSSGETLAIINTLEGKKIYINIDRLIRIKHQIKGKQSKTFIEKVRKDIETYNTGIQEIPDVKRHKEEIQLWVNKYNEVSNEINKKQQEIDTLVKENNELIEKIRSLQSKFDEKSDELESLKSKYHDDCKDSLNYQYTIEGLIKALISGASDNQQKQMEDLTDVIKTILNI